MGEDLKSKCTHNEILIYNYHPQIYVPKCLFPYSMADPNLAQILTEKAWYFGQYVASDLAGLFL